MYIIKLRDLDWRPGLDSWPMIALCMEGVTCQHCDER